MLIEIAGHQAPSCFAALSMKPGELDAIIITNPDWPPLPHYITHLAKDYLRMEFLDTKDPTNPHCPKKEHVEKMLDWSKGRNKLLVCCHAGISRSSATALLIAARESGVDEAFSVLTPGWHHPNRLILKHGSEILGLPVYDAYMNGARKSVTISSHGSFEFVTCNCL